MQIKLSKAVRTTIILTKGDDGFYYLTTNVTVFSRTQKFIPGMEIIQKTVDGRLVRNVFHVKGNKLIENQYGDKNVTIRREFFENELVSTSTCGNVVSTTLCRVIED